MSQVLGLAARQMEALGGSIHHHQRHHDPRHLGFDHGLSLNNHSRHHHLNHQRNHSLQHQPPHPVELAEPLKASPSIIPSPSSPACLSSRPDSSSSAAAGTPSAKKRASTLGSLDIERGMPEPLATPQRLDAAAASRDALCLCTPTPKIPRPRNAFILYRQHHQAQVTIDNPKLSNPDISKIIGEKWKNESDEVKQTWKKLAEEEKQRHQSQYPNYRYQPRRGNKPQAGGSNWAATSPTEDNGGRCSKCSGRTMATPQTPSTPYAGSQGPAGLQRLDTAVSRRSSFELSPTSTFPLLSAKLPPVRDMDGGEPLSPDMKRRRTDGAGGYLVGGPLAGYKQAADLAPTPSDAFPAGQASAYGRVPLPELGRLPRSQSGPMPPPLRPASSWLDPDGHGRRHSGFDESLRLPPLQTSSPSRSATMDARCVTLPSAALAVSPPVRAVDEAVMAMPLGRKLALLATVCQPAPPLLKGVGGTRGAFIAVEGPDGGLRLATGNAIQRGLAACGEIQLKVWRDDGDKTGWEEGRTPAAGRGSAAKFGGFFEPYLQAVSSWQRKSKQIGRHITGTRALLPRADEQQADGEPIGGRARSTEACTPPDDNVDLARVPVALAKDGFSLTLADRFACAMPIPDAYGAEDHWQWMATLWRGTVCPDLVVYVTPTDADDNHEHRTVELSRRMGLLVVKAPAAQGLDEATERRLAFEVLEWMREASFRHPLPRDWRSDLL